MSSEMSEQELAVQKLSEYLQTDGITAGLNQVPKLAPESFEKDTKLHVQFVWAASVRAFENGLQCDFGMVSSFFSDENCVIEFSYRCNNFAV